MTEISLDKYTGCLIEVQLECIRAPIEFMDCRQLNPLTDKMVFKIMLNSQMDSESFTDDTQMTLFTAEGLLRAYHRFVLKNWRCFNWCSSFIFEVLYSRCSVKSVLNMVFMTLKKVG